MGARKGVGRMLFRKKIERNCSYCAFGAKIDEDAVMCKKCGVVPTEHQCRRFRYDPLKRVPVSPKQQDFSKYENRDYSL